MLQFRSVSATEILDSRSRPTLSITLATADGFEANAGVPSGASTGTREAVELRDGDPARYGGAGVTTAVGQVNGEIAEALTGRTFASLAELDAALIELDGTPTTSRLGANALVGSQWPPPVSRPGFRTCRCGAASPRPAICRHGPGRCASTSSTAAHTPRTAWTSRSS